MSGIFPFFYYSNLYSHGAEKQQVHINRKKECFKCQEKFEDMILLDNHVRLCCDLNLDFECNRCETKWANDRTLILHLLSDHGGVKDAVCDICGKILKKRGHLKHHKLLHSETKEHVCDTCGMKFRLIQGLQRHINRMHNKQNLKFGNSCQFKSYQSSVLSLPRVWIRHFY
jgi:hypothetical protein